MVLEIIRLFQFPTGQNSTLRALFPEIIPIVGFNSQRDGILLYLTAFICLKGIGFNSQRDGILPKGLRLIFLENLVSIPNGMEFYIMLMHNLVLMSRCFNSQRDGILLIIIFYYNSFFNVSIPNGMEFYQHFVVAYITAIARFNSQRDGILLRLKRHKVHIARFQFPTGWNSTA